MMNVHGESQTQFKSDRGYILLSAFMHSLKEDGIEMLYNVLIPKCDYDYFLFNMFWFNT